MAKIWAEVRAEVQVDIYASNCGFAGAAVEFLLDLNLASHPAACEQ